MVNIGKFRKKPVEIEAVQWVDPEEAGDLVDWAEGDLCYHGDTAGPSDPETGADWGLLEIATLEGVLHVRPRDWIIRGVQGEFYLCKPDIFEATYEVAQ